jgi:hypothetical protein
VVLLSDLLILCEQAGKNDIEVIIAIQNNLILSIIIFNDILEYQHLKI